MYRLSNRRYTGSKLKLADWIVQLIRSECSGGIFCDLFAGTGVISERLLPVSDTVILNDILYSNEVIYHAFFGQEACRWDKIREISREYENIFVSENKGNYVVKEYGGRYFSLRDAAVIGTIREDIEQRKHALSRREYQILLASLLYAADRSAHTVGHFDAFIKNAVPKDRFRYGLIDPVETKGKCVKIYREDANQLVSRISADIVYIDPPYNSRQYSRFYHVLENLTKWEKPELSGIARKPNPENMSEYCKTGAEKCFAQLIGKLNCRYIVVSYNNTYASKSSSSQNKMTLESLTRVLESRGKLQVYEKPHTYFNAGKTEFKGHKEQLFIVKVGA